MSTCYWCPFSACIGCIHQGGDTPTEQGRKQGLTCDNREKAAPASSELRGPGRNLARRSDGMSVSATTPTALCGDP